MLVVLVLSACGGGSKVDPNEAGELQPYINTSLGFRVDYPSNWRSSEDPDFLVGDFPDKLHAVMFLRDESGGALFTVLIQQLDGEKQLTDFGGEQLAGAQSQASGATYAELTPTRLGGVDALSTQTRVTQSGQTRIQRVVFALNKGRGYAVSMIAPEDSPLSATMDRMLASFGFVP